MKLNIIKTIFAGAFFLLISCSQGSNDSAQGGKGEKAPAKKQMNLTIMLDLSDRIDTVLNPEQPHHFERDIKIVEYLASHFADEMKASGAYMAKGKIKVVFSPKPKDPNINILADKLDEDLSSADVKQKKEVHDRIISVFGENTRRIYEATLKDKKWIGSDIWRFFKNDVRDQCVERDTNYRNVLVLLTDGYIYHKDSREQAGNRYAYILPELFKKHKLRNNNDWEKAIKEQDFGLIVKRSDLQDLEVLVLEVAPSGSNRDDEDLIKHVLSDWFTRMQVKRYAIYNTQLPKDIEGTIKAFLQ